MTVAPAGASGQLRAAPGGNGNGNGKPGLLSESAAPPRREGFGRQGSLETYPTVRSTGELARQHPGEEYQSGGCARVRAHAL